MTTFYVISRPYKYIMELSHCIAAICLYVGLSWPTVGFTRTDALQSHLCVPSALLWRIVAKLLTQEWQAMMNLCA